MLVCISDSGGVSPDLNESDSDLQDIFLLSRILLSEPVSKYRSDFIPIISLHQQGLYHVFIDFKKAFDRVWHAALWATMRLYNINANLINAIQNLYDKATSAVCFNGSTGDWFRITVGVNQGCLLSPALFNIFLERIMADALEDHKSTVSIGGRPI